MKSTVAEIMSELKANDLLIEMMGEPGTAITGIAAIEHCAPGDLVFTDKKEYLEIVQTRRPAAVVTTPALKGLFADVTGTAVLIAPNVPLAHALLKHKYSARDYTKTGWTKIHPSAIVHETAKIDPSTVIEPRAVVGANTKIGKNGRIMAGVVIENDVVIGDEAEIHPNVVIGYGCRLGNQVVIEAGTVIGSEGYGFAQDKKRKSYPIPQTGIVVLEDRVRLGANCCVDRGTYKETRIGAGTKLDNLCHVAHNVQIGEDCLLTAMLCVAGSTKIGNRVITSGQTGIIDHMKVCDDAVLVHRAGVTKDIEKPGAYAGLPTQPLGDYMKNMAVLRTATELRSRVSRIETKLGLEPEA